MARSRLPRTAVCVLRIENRGKGQPLITVTSTLDVTEAPRGEARSVASYDEALSLVASFLRKYASIETQRPDAS